MILPVYLYGCPVLRKVASEINSDYEGLDALIENMWETMYKSDGIGLAAPQIGLSIRLFVIDLSPMEENDPALKDFKKVFINAKILGYSSQKDHMGEGCLSIPGIHEEVTRPDSIEIEYYDENFEYKKEMYDGYPARVIQHEYDHIEGKMFVDYLSAIRKKMLRGKLSAISKGKADAEYRTVTP